MLINRSNYESFFILYMDNELSADERRAVEAFVELHPDLKEELDLLMQFRLEPDTTVSYFNKEELLKENGETPFAAIPAEEWMSRAVDGELNTAEQKQFHSMLAADTQLQQDFAFFQKTKLQPEAIAFPDKASLYRREEKVRFVYWRRIAAILVLLLAGTAVFISLNRNKPGQTESGIAGANPVKKEAVQKENNQKDQPQQTNTQEENLARINTVQPEKKEDLIPEKQPANHYNVPDQQAVASGLNKEKKEKINPAVNTHLPNVVNNQKTEPVYAAVQDQQPSNHLPVPESNKSVINTLNNGGVNNAVAANLQPNPEISLPVTNTKPAALYTSNTDAADENEAAPESRKGGLRGFIRKVGRNLERRTNAESGDDGRVLIGGLAFARKSNP